MRHLRRYQAIPVVYRSLEGYSDACVLQRHMIPREETHRAISTARIYSDLTVSEFAFLAGYQVRSRSDFPTRRASSSERAADPHVPLKGTKVPFRGHRSKLIRFLFHARAHTHTHTHTKHTRAGTQTHMRAARSLVRVGLWGCGCLDSTSWSRTREKKRRRAYTAACLFRFG